jgi:lysophospholipase L1-like esterase
MKKSSYMILVVFIACSFKASDKPVSIFIAGDSTAQTYYEERDGLIKGWGQLLPLFLDSNISVVNHAIGGRSTKSFISEGRWGRLIKEVHAGDIVLIQFGHNDASSRPERHTSYDDYRQNLIKMIQEVRSKEATPILLTSVVMRTFKDGNLVDDRLKGYPVITRKIAEEQQVALIDINLKTRDFITMLGDESSKPFYRWLEPGVDPTKPEGIKDDTHMMEKGAKQVAFFVAEGLMRLNLPGISRHIVIPKQKNLSSTGTPIRWIPEDN